MGPGSSLDTSALCWLVLASLLVPAIAIVSQQKCDVGLHAHADHVGGVMESSATSKGHRRQAVRLLLVALFGCLAWCSIGFSLAFGQKELLDGAIGSFPQPRLLAHELLAGAGHGWPFVWLSGVRVLTVIVGLASCDVVRVTWTSPLVLAFALSVWLLLGLCPPMHWVWSANGGLRVRGAYDVSGALSTYVAAASGLCVVARECVARGAGVLERSTFDDILLALDINSDRHTLLFGAPRALVGGARGAPATALAASRRPCAPCCVLVRRSHLLFPGLRCAPSSAAVLLLLGAIGLHASSALSVGGSATSACLSTVVSVRAPLTPREQLYVMRPQFRGCPAGAAASSCVCVLLLLLLCSRGVYTCPRCSSAPPQAVIGSTVWAVFAELRKRRKQMSIAGLRSSVSFAMMGGRMVVTSPDTRPAGRYSDVALGAVLGVACAAASGGAQPLRAAAVQALGGSAFAALAAGSIESLFVVEGRHDPRDLNLDHVPGAAASGQSSVLDAPSHALILAGFAAAPLALVLATFWPLSLPPATPNPREVARADGSLIAVQLLAIIGSALWSATVMQLVLLLTRGGCGSGKGKGHPRNATASSLRSHPPSALGTRRGTDASWSGCTPAYTHKAYTPAALARSPAVTYHGSSCATHSAQPASPPPRRPLTVASTVAVDVPVVLPNGGKALLRVCPGDEIDELARRFCAQHQLSEDCAPHIHEHLAARYADAQRESAGAGGGAAVAAAADARDGHGCGAPAGEAGARASSCQFERAGAAQSRTAGSSVE